MGVPVFYLVTSDPVGLSDGPSTYGYVQGNPLNSYDPNGLTSLSLCANPINAAACAALGGATLDGGINVGVQAYNKGWSCIDWDEAGGKALEGALLGVGGYGVGLGVVKYGGGLLAGLGRGFGGLADDVSRQAAKKAIHKNSLDYVGDTHVYRVKGPNGTHKIGESAQGTRVRDGASIRAEQQARKLTRETGDVYTTVIRKTFPDKASARNYETRLIERFRRIYGEDSLPGNKTNR